jgi:hypothetical protein
MSIASSLTPVMRCKTRRELPDSGAGANGIVPGQAVTSQSPGSVHSVVPSGRHK